MKRALEVPKNNVLPVAALLLGFILIFILSPNSRSIDTVFAMLRQGFAPAVLAWGVLFNLGVGNWDFSVGAEVLLASIIGGNLAQMLGLGVPGLILCCILVGVACAALVSFVYWLLRIPTLIASIGMLLIYESVSSILFNGNGVQLDSSYVVMGKFPWNILSFLAAFTVAYVLYYRRRFGYKVRAVGSNPKVAQVNGINVLHVKMGALIAVGLFAGIYSAINLGSAGVARSATNMTSMSVCFDSMMCVFVGMAIRGKGNMVFSVYCGAVIMQMVKMLLTILQVPAAYNKVIIAIIVTVLMVLSSRTDVLQSVGRRFRYLLPKRKQGASPV